LPEEVSSGYSLFEIERDFLPEILRREGLNYPITHRYWFQKSVIEVPGPFQTIITAFFYPFPLVGVLTVPGKIVSLVSDNNKHSGKSLCRIGKPTFLINNRNFAP
jgi:hypothetical protein